MKKIEFSSYDHYVKTQEKTVNRRGLGPYFTDVEMQRIADWCKLHDLIVRRGICHGARNGLEADELMKVLPGSAMFGTDLFPYSGKSALVKGKATVVRCDFAKRHPRWVGRFDLVYSNSLDHALNPEETLKVWFEQLGLEGVLFVQWNRSDLTVKAGDCFGGELMEHVALMNQFGKVVDLLYVNVPWEKGSKLRRHALECVVIVARRKASQCL